MIIDGRALAQKMNTETAQGIASLGKVPVLDLIYAGENPAIESFISIKQKVASKVGVTIQIHRLPGEVTQDEIREKIDLLSQSSNGIIVQLPLPGQIDMSVLDCIPTHLDVDILGSAALEDFQRNLNQAGDSNELPYPPVAGAVREVLHACDVELVNKKIVVIGEGILVGVPVLVWLRSLGCSPLVVTKEQGDISRDLLDADIVISGAGVPHLVRPEHISDGVVLVDAGTSELHEKVVGDIHPDCAIKALYSTPVPGGIGPLTVAVLMRNTLVFCRRNSI